MEIIFIIILLVIGISAYLISRKVFDLLKKKGNRWALILSILSFIVYSALVLFVIGFIILSNADFGR